MNARLNLSRYRRALEDINPMQSTGRVSQVVGLVVEANGPAAPLGSVCNIYANDHESGGKAEIMGFRGNHVLLVPLEELNGIAPGDRVIAAHHKAQVPVGEKLLGRVIDGLGRPMDGRGPIEAKTYYPLYAESVNPLARCRISEPMDVGIRAINGLLTIGAGQRVGIFAGSGIGKSVLLGMIARNTTADVNVIALIGERGREVNEFIEKDLKEDGLRRSVLVVATSDRLPLIRRRGAYVATAIAEYFRDQGLSVNLMMDSITRLAMAQREMGLAMGEPPTTKGYTPSVFTLLPKLLERAGTCRGNGPITGFYTVLMEGDDLNDPIVDAMRSVLDGHIVLSREMAMQNRYPAIDVLNSVSRVFKEVASKSHRQSSARFKSVLATYKKSEDLINIGAYHKGSNPRIDEALLKIDSMNDYLKQKIDDAVPLADSINQLEGIFKSNTDEPSGIQSLGPPLPTGA